MNLSKLCSASTGQISPPLHALFFIRYTEILCTFSANHSVQLDAT